MTAELIDLASLLSRGMIFRIPLYQRPYGWGEDLCANLVEDFRELVRDPNAIHYLGNLVVQSPKSDSGKDEAWSIIDGQQRLTSLFLLLDADDSKDFKPCQKLRCQPSRDGGGEGGSALDPEGAAADSVVKRNFEGFKEAGTMVPDT